MHYIKADNASKAWIHAVKYILYKGESVFDKNERLRETLNLVLEIQNPTERNQSIEKLIPREFIQEVTDLTFRKEVNEKLGYSYGERMFNFKGINQVQWVINRLNKNPSTKSATIGTLMPEKDTKAEHIPCMNLLDFKKRDGKLNLIVVFRSHDYGKKVLPNLIALGELLKQVSDETNSNVGKLICHSISAHIYETEFETVKRIIKSAFES